jgi:hypothetical protein
MADEIIKERMLLRLKKSADNQWLDEGPYGWNRVLMDMYLTKPGGCIHEDYLSDEVLNDIREKFYWFFDAIRDEFEPFIEVYVIPSYEDVTVSFLILDDKLLYRDACKAWNFWFDSEEDLVEEMYEIYRHIKAEGKWRLW